MPRQPMVLEFLPCGICYWCSFCCCRRRLSKKEFNSDKVFYQVFCCCFRRRLPKTEGRWIRFTFRYLELDQLSSLWGHSGNYLKEISRRGRESNLNFEKGEVKRREREERVNAVAIRGRSRYASTTRSESCHE